MYGILQLSPRKWCVVQCDNSIQALSGVAVQNAGHAKIVFGPVKLYSQVVNEMIRLTRKTA